MKMHLGTRLSIAFGIISCVVFLSIGVLSYQNMQHMLETQQDQSLAARIARIEIFLEDPDSFDVLVQHPKLYENMMGQEDNLLILQNENRKLININPLDIQIPKLSYKTELSFQNNQLKHPSTRFAYKQVEFDGQSYYLIAAKQLASSQQVLGHYLAKLIFYSVFGIVLSTLLAWLMGHYVLRSIRQLIHATQQVNIQQLDKRIELKSHTVEVQHLTHAMNTMLADIQKGYEQLSRFSEDISHEFRTPLNNLMGQTQIALSQSRNIEDYENLLYSHLEEYERLNQMIENMLFIARVEHGDYPIEKHEINLQSMLNDLLEYFELLSEEKNMKIHLRINEGLMVFAHMELLQRALANLLSNAICYGHMQGEILIEVRTAGQTQIIEITTVGVVIAEQHLNHLFERFYQIDPSRHQKAQTGGLGLAIVDSIMQLHQGRIEVHNSLKGVVFKLYLPV